MRFGVKSDKGLIREINEDSYNIIAGYSGVPVSFIIADGMGGHNSGEIASKMAVDYLSSSLLNMPEGVGSDNVPSIIKKMMNEANKYIYDYSKENEDNYGMGTTLIVAVVYQKNFYIGHVGDSRVYLIRDSKIERLTVDHSYIEELVRSGNLTREEAENHPKKNIITRALGCTEEIQVDTYISDIRNNDTYLLCTDGLTNMVSEDDIFAILNISNDPEVICKELIDTANKRGGDDNITVIVVKND